MRTFLHYAWPVLVVMAFQGFLLNFPAKSPRLAVIRIALFVGWDLGCGWVKYRQFRRERSFRREMDEFRRQTQMRKEFLA